MKRISILFPVFLASMICAYGADKGTSNSAAEPRGKPAKIRKRVKIDDRVAPTGSYIKQDIHRKGMVTDGANSLFVLDSNMIRNSGAADLRQLLVLRGLSR
ncbi:MAG TPA: hypothetical protein VKY92_12130 [Verrucomicrobiae bacterium]|nr:hypothetical protein [Verrucomicrobiae bacterium]